MLFKMFILALFCVAIFILYKITHVFTYEEVLKMKKNTFKVYVKKITGEDCFSGFHMPYLNLLKRKYSQKIHFRLAGVSGDLYDYLDKNILKKEITVKIIGKDITNKVFVVVYLDNININEDLINKKLAVKYLSNLNKEERMLLSELIE